MNEPVLFGNVVAIPSFYDGWFEWSYIMKWKDKQWLYVQNVHGEEDGTINSHLGSGKVVFEQIESFAETLNKKHPSVSKENWIVHPCYPKAVKECFPEYASHIIGDWNKVTRHVHNLTYRYVIAGTTDMLDDINILYGGSEDYARSMLELSNPNPQAGKWDKLMEALRDLKP